MFEHSDEAISFPSLKGARVMARFDDRSTETPAECVEHSRRDFVRALGVGVLGSSIPWIGLPARAADAKAIGARAKY